MSLLDRASRFVNGANADDTLIGIIRDCVSDGGITALAAVQRLAEDMYGGITYNFELKAAAAYALCMWGENGLNALVEMATRSPRSKNTSLCVQILAGLAAGSLSRLERFAGDRELVSQVRAATAQNEPLRLAARQRLHKFVLDLADDRDAIEIVGRQLSFLFEDTDLNMARELFAALASRQLAVNGPTLARYRELLATAGDDEPALQKFLETTPQLLDPAAVSVWPQPNIVGAKEPDFVLRRWDDTYVVIEIETPSKQLVTMGNQLSADATHAVAQATDYRAFLMARLDMARNHFAHFDAPECLVVIGLEATLSAPQRAALARANHSYHSVRVVGFDWLANRAEAVLRNAIEALPVEARVRML